MMDWTILSCLDIAGIGGIGMLFLFVRPLRMNSNRLYDILGRDNKEAYEYLEDGLIEYKWYDTWIQLHKHDALGLYFPKSKNEALIHSKDTHEIENSKHKLASFSCMWKYEDSIHLPKGRASPPATHLPAYQVEAEVHHPQEQHSYRNVSSLHYSSIYASCDDGGGDDDAGDVSSS